METIITQKIQSFEDAARALGLDPTALPQVTGLSEKHASAIIANYKLWVIAEALNEGWAPDWNNYDQWKYYPWFDMESYGEQVGSGSGFAFGGYGYVGTISCVGSRLCFKSSELAEYAGKQFLDLYREVYVLPKA